MKYCKFNAVSVPTTKKTNKPKFTTKKVEPTATKKTNSKKTEKTE